MKIRSLLPKIIFCLAALTAGHQARATLLGSSWNLYATFVFGGGDFKFTYGINEDFDAGASTWDTTLLTIDSFTNSVWGNTYTLNAGNTPAFAAFTSLITDGEEDWIGNRIVIANGSGGSFFSPEPWAIFGAPSGPFGVDLIGYNVSEITIRFEEDHFFEFSNPQVQGKYTVSFFGEPASVPDIGPAAGLLAGTLGVLFAAHRRLRKCSLRS